MTHTVLVTGSRDWQDKALVYKMLDLEYDFATKDGGSMVLRHGACPTGADEFAEAWYLWKRMNGYVSVDVDRHPANWALGKFAGPKRNMEMVDAGVDIVLAFPLGASKGTRGTMKYALSKGIPVKDCS